MEKTSKRKTAAIVAAAVILLLVGAFALIQAKNSKMSIDIPREDLDYIVIYCRGLGPKKLDYAEHSAMIDSVAETLSGEYKFAGLWSNKGVSGGGPNTVLFYFEGSNEPLEVQYVNGRVAVERRSAGHYRLYKKADSLLVLSELEEYATAYGSEWKGYLKS